MTFLLLFQPSLTSVTRCNKLGIDFQALTKIFVTKIALKHLTA